MHWGSVTQWARVNCGTKTRKGDHPGPLGTSRGSAGCRALLRALPIAPLGLAKSKATIFRLEVEDGYKLSETSRWSLGIIRTLIFTKNPDSRKSGS